MKIHEYQAKEIFANYGIPVTRETLCFTKEEVLVAAESLGFPCVVKAQVLVGGRGKAVLPSEHACPARGRVCHHIPYGISRRLQSRPQLCGKRQLCTRQLD